VDRQARIEKISALLVVLAILAPTGYELHSHPHASVEYDGFKISAASTYVSGGPANSIVSPAAGNPAARFTF
jgi:hypothetical protein